MTYTEAYYVTVSRVEAKREIERHGCNWLEFINEVGDKQEYEGSDVLDWLGY